MGDGGGGDGERGGGGTFSIVRYDGMSYPAIIANGIDYGDEEDDYDDDDDEFLTCKISTKIDIVITIQRRESSRSSRFCRSP